MLGTPILMEMDFGPWMIVILPVLVLLSLLIFFAKRYKRCPSNRVLVVYGKIGGERTAKCIHGGGLMVWPIIQDYAFLSLEPITIEIDLQQALSLQNIRVNVPSTFTIGISTEPDIMQNAAERLLGLPEREVADTARDIILGQLRLVIATLSIEEINQDREKFLELITKNVGYELNKIGLAVINVNIRDITDESAYIEAIGKKAAADAMNKAKVDVAVANKEGAIGEATAQRDREIQVAKQVADSAAGQKQAERDRRVAVAQYEAEGISGEADARKQQEIAVAEQAARTLEGQKQAEREQRVKIATLEAEAVQGENTAKAEIADYEATLEERRADAKRRGEVALAQAQRDVLIAEQEQEQARLEKEQVVKQLIEQKKIQIDADAEAERIRRIARGQADGILAKYEAEAKGIQAVLEAKARGYQNLLAACGDQKQLAATLLVVEKLPQLVEEQVKAIQNLKIDKITVWDGGAGGDERGATAGFLRGLIGSLPPIHELARQAGVELPDYLGTTKDGPEAPKGPKRDGEAQAGKGST